MRLGFHYHIPAIQKNGLIFTAGPLGKFIDSLAINCESIICFMHEPLSNELEILDYEIKSKNVYLVNMGKHVQVYKRVIFWKYYVKNIYKYRHKIDAMLVRCVTPLLAYVAKSVDKVPLALLWVGEYTNISDLPQPIWRKEMIRLWSIYNTHQQSSLAKNNLVMVNNKMFLEKYSNLNDNIHLVKTTTLSESDFFHRNDTCNEYPIKLLYVGRIERQKGIFEIIQAVKEINDKGIAIVLNIIGKPDIKDDILDKLFDYARDNGIEELIKFHGFITHGPELFKYFKTSDVFIIASTSEGFPRSIWEAMANGLPVIATKVGGIPYLLKHRKHAMLCQPKDHKLLTGLIEEVINDNILRKTLIKNGYELVKEYTLEKSAALIMYHINTWVNKQKLDSNN